MSRKGELPCQEGESGGAKRLLDHEKGSVGRREVRQLKFPVRRQRKCSDGFDAELGRLYEDMNR